MDMQDATWRTALLRYVELETTSLNYGVTWKEIYEFISTGYHDLLEDETIDEEEMWGSLLDDAKDINMVKLALDNFELEDTTSLYGQIQNCIKRNDIDVLILLLNVIKKNNLGYAYISETLVKERNMKMICVAMNKHPKVHSKLLHRMLEYGTLDMINKFMYKYEYKFSLEDKLIALERCAFRSDHDISVEIVLLILKDERIYNECLIDLIETVTITCSMGNAKLVKSLLKYPNIYSSYNRRGCFHYAVEGCHADIIKLLMKDPQVDITAAIINGEKLLKSVKQRKFAMVELLVNVFNVDPSYNNNRALEAAYVDICNSTPLRNEFDGYELINIMGFLLRRTEVINMLSPQNFEKYSSMLGG